VHWNINGFGNSKDELIDAAGRLDLDVICLQESKLTGKSPPPKIPGYDLHRKDRAVPRGSKPVRGGGLLTFVKNSIKSLNVPTRSRDALEIQQIKVFLKNRSVNLLNVYAPPTRSTDDDSRGPSFDLTILPDSPDTIIVGDFNAHSYAWSTGKPNKEGALLESWLDSSTMVALNDGSPTFISSSFGSKSSPDVTICSTNLIPSVDWQVLPSLGSDHLPICISLDLERNSLQLPSRHNWHKADWQAFQKALPSPPTFKFSTFHQAYKLWLSQLQQATDCAVPTTSTRRRHNPWLTPEIRQVISNRNQAQSNGDAKLCSTLTSRANDLIKEAKREIFQDKISLHSNNIWPLIKQIDGGQTANQGNALTAASGETVTTDKAIAREFINTYAIRSRNPQTTRADRKDVITAAKRAVAGDAIQGHTPPQIELSELQTHISNLKVTGAPGPDSIHNMAIRHLPPDHVSFLLRVINHSLATGDIPMSWKEASIIPIPKPGKPLTSTSSYRPIALTSCVAKLAERVVLNRLKQTLEPHLHPAQAGFRKLRSTDDHLAWLTQNIIDGFGKCERTVAAFLDLSAAFDVAWRPAIVNQLHKLSTPPHLTRWIARFLSNRTADVIFNGTKSRRKCIRQGVPQGSVLSPTLFATLVNDLPTKCATNGVNISLYADDIAIWSTSKRIHRATAKVQEATQKVFAFLRELKLIPNETKSVVSLFTADTHEAKIQPTICPYPGDPTPLPFDPKPKFLGLTLDRSLFFGPHVDAIRGKMVSRLNAIRAIASTRWGAAAHVIRQAYLGYVASVAHYASAIWATGASTSHLTRVEAANCSGARAITGCCLGTPLDILRNEAQILPISEVGTSAATTLREKILRTPNHPSRPACLPTQREINFLVGTNIRPHAHKRRSNYFRLAGLTTSTFLGAEALPRDSFHINPPAFTGLGHVSFLPYLQASRSDAPEVRLSRAREKLSQLTQTPHVIWTDGSARDATYDGGSACHFEFDNARDIKLASGKLCSSYQAEMLAIKSALQSVHNDPPTGLSHLRICSDSQSSILSIQGGSGNNPIIQDIRKLLRQLPPTDMVYIPAHVNLQGNETADALAGQASLLPQDLVPISLRSVKAATARLLRKSRTDALLTAVHGHRHNYPSTLGNINPLQVHRLLGRQDAVTIAQLRTGDSMLLGEYRQRIGLEGTGTCPACWAGPGNLDHLLFHCGASKSARSTFSSDHPMSPSVLSSHPADAISLLPDRL
jgi:ribonuclease HI